VILATPYGNRYHRAFEGTDFLPPPDADVGLGGLMRRRRDLSVTAVACAVKLVAETIGGFVMRTYEGDSVARVPLLDDPNARLFQQPAEDVSSFEFWSDVATSLELEKHSVTWKVKAGRRGVDELIPMDPGYFRIYREKPTSPMIVEARVDGAVRNVTRDVVVVRGWAAVPGVDGVSTLSLHKEMLRGARSYDEYRGRYFDNDATPGIILEHPGRPSRDQRRDLLAAWMRRHSGSRQRGRPGLVWGGVKVHPVSANLRESQAVELSDAIAREVARAFRIYPIDLMHAAMKSGGIATAELWSDVFIRFSLWGRIRRIERAFARDRDLYPDWKKYPRFDTFDFHRGDISTTANKIRDLVQVGVMVPNEGRGELGLPPHPDGDKLNWPPVGGTSPAKGGGGTDAPPVDDDEDDDPPDTGDDTQED
jgi:HK97 family phage portal protein